MPLCVLFSLFLPKQHSLKSYFIPYNPARIARASCESSLLRHYRGTMHVRVQVCGRKRHVSFTAYDLLKYYRFKGIPTRAITRIDDVVVFEGNTIVKDAMGTYIWNWRN